ncbi:MAG TPA: carboxypeptidase regulatory-like domain-containing protein, partial [Longimicrobiales bacterium]|nr:carboxypeptidase regulatory-like domain-containing protein [Longimicrobiales bacterium]
MSGPGARAAAASLLVAAAAAGASPASARPTPTLRPAAAPTAPSLHQEVTGSLTGRVAGPDGRPLPGLTVRVTGVDGGRSRTGATDDAGGFRFPRLAPGLYAVEVRGIGRRTVRLSGVAVELGRTTALPPTTLEVQAIPLEPLEVDVGSALVDPTRTSLGTTLRTAFADRLPVGRTYDSMLELLPHANESFLGDPVNVAGGTGLENAYYVEGVDVTDVFRGRGGTDLPFELVEAIELEHGGYEAEHGGALGGIVNVATRSGGDRFEARTFGTWSGSGLAADASGVPGVLERTTFSEVDAGASLAGPVAPGRAWFFGAWHPSLVREEVV